VLYNKKTAEKISKFLLQSKAIILNPKNPFTWSSGITSPIYCDNRILLSFTEYRIAIKNIFCEIIAKEYPETNIICGVATGGIPQASLIADKMNLPLIYVRPSSKKHGRKNSVEGKTENNQNVIVIEDLISTGGSSIKGALQIRENHCNVLSILSVFDYGFNISKKNMQANKINYFSLTDLETTMKIGVNENYITKEEVNMIENWKSINFG